jgi:hypothetical protein
MMGGVNYFCRAAHLIVAAHMTAEIPLAGGLPALPTKPCLTGKVGKTWLR